MWSSSGRRLMDALLDRSLRSAARCWPTARFRAELPFGHPNFLWPCHGITHLGRTTAGCRCYAIDISRSADGQWWALADRHPGAIGTRLRAGEPADRLARSFPTCCNESWGCGRLAVFSRALREESARGTRRTNEAPLAVVLTPGQPSTKPTSNMPIWRASWACRWSRASDLTVRGRHRLFLKTLGGFTARTCDPAPSRRRFL